MSGFFQAARYLTIVPLPGPAAASLTSLGGTAAWFPVVGLALGAALLVVERVTGKVFPSLLAALLTVAAWKLLTGGLHLDGLADCLDGLVGRDADHRLAIMRDSRIGAFGAIGLIIFLLLEIVAVAELPPPVRSQALLAAPVVGRVAPVLLAWIFPSARPEGQGAAFARGLSRVGVSVAVAIALAVALFALGLLGPIFLAAALAVALVFGGFLVRRLGGITGDVLGASIEVTTTLAYVGLVLT
ncbi:MAG: adenosylcobinamide-GDP ribazoletransferase [Candidatus Rokuibacteriota bacterium]